MSRRWSRRQSRKEHSQQGQCICEDLKARGHGKCWKLREAKGAGGRARGDSRGRQGQEQARPGAEVSSNENVISSTMDAQEGIERRGMNNSRIRSHRNKC